MRTVATALARTIAASSAVLLPFAALSVIYLLVAGLTTQTESIDRSLGLPGYFGFAVVATMICALSGAAGRALSSFPTAVRVGACLGWLLLGASVLLLLAFSFLPTAPPWVSWSSFRTFIALLGTPIVFAVAMVTYTMGFAGHDPGRRWASVLLLSTLPGVMIVLLGFSDPAT